MSSHRKKNQTTESKRVPAGQRVALLAVIGIHAVGTTLMGLGLVRGPTALAWAGYAIGWLAIFQLGSLRRPALWSEFRQRAMRGMDGLTEMANDRMAEAGDFRMGLSDALACGVLVLALIGIPICIVAGGGWIGTVLAIGWFGVYALEARNMARPD